MKNSHHKKSFVDHILLALLKFSCNYEKNGWCKKNVYFFHIIYILENFDCHPNNFVVLIK